MSMPPEPDTLTPASAVPGRRWRRWVALLLPALLIPALSWITPQYEAGGAMLAPLQLALALSVAATARFGWRALPAVALGALATALLGGLFGLRASLVTDSLVLLLQTAFAGLLLRRSSRTDDMALDSGAAIRRLAAAALSCAMIGALAELVTGAMSPSVTRPGLVALARATADGASVMLLVPVILAFIAPQKARWQARRRSVALPLVLIALLMLAALEGVEQRERLQAQARFDRDADVVFLRTQALLDAPLQAVQAVQGAMQASATPLPAPQFDALARPWVNRTAGIVDVGWLEVPRGEGGPVTVRHLLPATAGAAGAPAAASDTAAAAPGLRPLLNQALAEPAPLMAPVPQKAGAEQRPLVVVVQGASPDVAASQRPVVFASVALDRLLMPLLAARADALQGCLFDADRRSRERQRLYGPSSCDAAGFDGFDREAAFEMGGRRWTMRISQPLRTTGAVWLFALPALAGSALLAGLMLALTGRVQRVESESRLRSTDMQRDIDVLRAQLQRQERSLDGVFDAVQSGIALLEPDGRVQRCNTAFADLLGSPAAELRRRPIDELLQDAERPQQDRIGTLLREAGDELLHSSLQLRGAGGRVLPVLVTLCVLRERDGRAGSVVCAVHDLSESLRRRQAERVLGNVLELSARSEATASHPVTGPHPVTPTRPLPVATGTQRVLCIQPAGPQADQLDSALRERPQLALQHATSAADGLQRAAHEAPHLVLLDLALPDGDGLAVLQQLSSDMRTRAIPVIVLSDDPRPDRIDAAFSAGARAYLAQPLDARQLLAAIDDVM